MKFRRLLIFSGFSLAMILTGLIPVAMGIEALMFGSSQSMLPTLFTLIALLLISALIIKVSSK